MLACHPQTTHQTLLMLTVCARSHGAAHEHPIGCARHCVIRASTMRRVTGSPAAWLKIRRPRISALRSRISLALADPATVNKCAPSPPPSVQPRKRPASAARPQQLQHQPSLANTTQRCDLRFYSGRRHSQRVPTARTKYYRYCV